MKKPIIIANWKMSLGFDETKALTQNIIEGLKPFDFSMADVVVCPSHPMLHPIMSKLKDSEIMMGAQDCFWEEGGSFTSNVSTKMLKEIGCKYVILGHSERRRYNGETDQGVHKKVRQVLEKDLIPIVCVGESLDERRNLRSDLAVIKQVSEIFSGLNMENKQVVLAYEPVWAIGNQAVDSGEAEYMIKVIKHYLYDVFSTETVENNFTFIYGGSLNPENMSEFVSRESIDGGLIGGKSLKADSFVAMINNSINK